ncbi:MAG TPA: hypothetical protein VN605_09745, partial [Thermoanaerobaculia bacterium]|nr:hypothetical protein [Thermoanaerobaculia bacterium]
PAIAINRTHSLEVHLGADPGDTRLFYELGTFNGGRIQPVGSGNYDTGGAAHVALSDAGYVLEVHQSKNEPPRVFYNVGRIDGTKIQWNNKGSFDGANPSVSLNGSGLGIMAYEVGESVYYRILTTDGKSIALQAQHEIAVGASLPAVAVADDGWFLIAYSQNGALQQRTGWQDGTTVSWENPVAFDSAGNLSIAAQTGLAIQVHNSHPGETPESFSTSLLTNRSRWMTDRLGTLGALNLSQLILPGSHDAGMYAVSSDPQNAFARTQDQDIYQQLMNGQRWLDLAVAYLDGFGIYIDYSGVLGPTLDTVLAGIQSFMSQGLRELVIVKLSQFGNFSTQTWEQLVSAVEARLGLWLYRGPLPAGKRLADVTLNEYAGKVLVVVDGDWAKNDPHAGYWIYRDASSPDAAAGQLRVYDQPTKTASYDTMKNDQTAQFKSYDGECSDGSLCDLFLLSWTLTPASGSTTESVARLANPYLAEELNDLPDVNAAGKIVNILSVDWAEYARPADVAITEKAPV